MNISLYFVRGTDNVALYRNKHNMEIWIPRTVISHRRKWPAKDLNENPIHELTIEDWWWEKEGGGM